MYNLLRSCLLILTLLGMNSAYSQEIIKRDDGSEITYYLQKKQQGNDTLVLLIQGSDCNSIFNNPTINGDYHQLLPQADRLMVEKYAITNKLAYSLNDQNPDCPAAYIEHNTLTSRVDDLGRVLAKLQKRDKYRHIIVLGGSEGAAVTYLLAANNSHLPIVAIIGINGGGQKFIDDLEYAVPDPEAKAGVQQFYQLILKGEPITTGGDYSHKWWYSLFTNDQLNVLMQVNIPILIIQAKQDRNVSPEAVDKMVETLKAKGKQNITYFTYDELDHGLKDQEGKSHHKQVIKEINNWLETCLKPI